MATDATGTPTDLGIPTYNTNVDAPSGEGFNAAMDAIDALIAARSPKPATSGVKVWDSVNSEWDDVGGTADGTKFLRDDGTWQTASTPETPLVPATTLPGSPAAGDQAILTDSTTAPTWSWLVQYDTTISDANKWLVIGPMPLVSSGQFNVATAGYSSIAAVTAPFAGVYKVVASIMAANGAADPAPRVVVSGATVRTNTAAGSQYSRSKTTNYSENATMAASDQVVVQSSANGTDATWSEGTVMLIPVRII